MLASASPRRRELLKLLGVAFEVRPTDVAEEIGDGISPEIVARRLAREKAEAARLADGAAAILAADTVVVLDGAILGKPASQEEARSMLEALRGRTHEVITAVALLPHGDRSALVRHPATSVRMRSYSDEDIAASIARGDPFDKAGAYAIQDGLFRPVESYDGCYCNVVGLPLWSTRELLRKGGVSMSAEAGQLLPQCSACPLRPPS